MSSFDSKRNRFDPDEARPLWEDDKSPPSLSPNPTPGRASASSQAIPPAARRDKPRVIGSAAKTAWRFGFSAVVQWLAWLGPLFRAEIAAIARTTGALTIDLAIAAGQSCHVAFASVQARRAQLQLGRKALGQDAQKRPGDPSWRVAARDGQALQRAAEILDRGVVPPGSAREFGRAVATQAAFDQARRRRDEVRGRIRRGGTARWVRFGLGWTTILLVAFLGSFFIWGRAAR